MKKLSLIAILFIIFARCDVRAAAPTIVQHKSGFGSAISSLTVTLTSNVTAGNMIVVFVGTAPAASNTVNTPTMTGETFTKVTGASNAGTAPNGQIATYAQNSAAGGQAAVTVTTSSAAFDVHMHVIEVNGQSASPQDATGNTESATLSVSTSASTTTANDLVLAFFYDDITNAALTIGTGYTQVELSANATGGDAGLSESKTVSATGVQTATAAGNGTDICEQGIIAIAGTGAAPSCTNFIALLGAGCK